MKKLNNILKSKICCYIILFVAIIFALFLSKYHHYQNIDNNKFLGIVTYYKVKETSIEFDLKNKNKVRIVYYFNEEDFEIPFNLGDKVLIEGKVKDLNKNTIPNTFNYKNYLKSKNIYYLYEAKSIKKIENNKNILYIAKNSIRKYINSFKSKDYLNMFILGDKSYMNEEDIASFKEGGVSHIFAISGMHVSFMIAIIMFIFKKKKDIVKYSIIVPFLLFYLFLTNYSASILRTVFVFIFLLVNKKCKFNLDTINVFLISISILIIIYPNILYDVGFLYSVSTSYALINFSYIIRGNYFTKLIKTSTLAFLVSLPITVSISYYINILSVLNNIVVVPLISLIIFPLSILTFFVRPLDSFYLVLTKIVSFISSKLLVLNIVIPKMNIVIIILYYILLILFLISYQKKYLSLLILLIVFLKLYVVFDNNYYIYYLDVGQGDAAILKYRNQTIMIDTGGKSFGSSKSYIVNNYITFFNSIGINSIDYLVLSHGDYDHMGEAINLVNNFRVETVIFNTDEFNELETELIKVLESKKIKYYKGLKELNIGSNKLYFLNTKEYDNENDNSNVLYFKINNYKFLFMGDAGIEREKDILDKYNLSNIDFIKIGHHGSNTSSSKYFIDSIKPKNCLISVGKNNRYGHPKDSVLDLLDNYCDIYRTDLDGSVEIEINKNNYKIKTYNP